MSKETSKGDSSGELLENKKTGEIPGGFGPAEIAEKNPIPQVSAINPLSYAALVRDFNRFRAVARSKSDMYDMPGHVYFRVLFHFDNGADARVPAPGTLNADGTDGRANAWTGLIAPSWLDFSNKFNFEAKNQGEIETLWRSSTAFNYFVLNGDTIRAKQTKQFVELLSSISSNSPWYFQNIKGLETAIERSVAAPGAEFQFKEERDKITIECLDDSYDQRIGTLLDLYRAIVWSWETKRQMLPSNLRKFDMTIVAFQLPLRGKHVTRNLINMGNIKDELISDNVTGEKISKVIHGARGVTNIYTNDSDAPVASFKAWEFHGCEIDYNSSKSGWGELDNAAGSTPKYNIDIFFDDVFETRFNEFIPSTITDIVGDNIPYQYKEDLSTVKLEDQPITNNYSAPYTGPNDGILDQLIGAGKEWVATKLKKIYLGNMSGLSIKRIGSQINQALDGDLWGTVGNVSNYVRGNWEGGDAQPRKNIFQKPNTPSTDRIISLGNLFRANTTLNT